MIHKLFLYLNFTSTTYRIRPELHKRLLMGPIVVCILAVLALIMGHKRQQKQAGYSTVPGSVGTTIIV